jgi:integrase
MARRRYGSGGVKQRADGRWEGRLWLADGTRRSIYARSREHLVVRLQEERWRLAWGIPVKAKGLLLSDYLRQWLEVARARLRPRTFDAYEICLRRVERPLGRVPVANLTPQLIQRTYADLLASGLSPRTVLHTHAVLHRALKQARRWGLMVTNPTELVAAPRPPQQEMTAFSAMQLRALLANSRQTRWYPLWVVLGTAGLRIGEALGLKWSDVDLVTGRLQVKRALQRQRGRGLVFVEPKSFRSRRLVCLSNLAIEALREQRVRSRGELVSRTNSASRRSRAR